MSAAPLTPEPRSPLTPEIAVGFIGLGRMGFRLAQNLVRFHVPVIAYNRTQAKVEPLVAQGARWVASPKDLARSVSNGVIFLMLTDGKAVQKVLFGRGGLSRAAAPGTLVVDLSTVDPEESRTFAARLGERGLHYIDAPVGGSIDMAAQGEVTFFVGGDEQDVARARPLLLRMGRAVEHVGPVGAGTSMKLVNNLLTIGYTVLATEALALADSLHLERGRVLDLLLAGGGRSAMLERKSAAFRAGQYPPQFTTALARKDLRLAEKASTREGRPLKMSREARKLLDEAIAQGRSEDDFSSVLEATLARGRPRTTQTTSAVAVGAPAPAPPGDGVP
ncbi:MAG: NAD(P)-dependent oxidoreductase [Thermoplasmata archaeon]|nr:NAD(P)-dependent oxidoreductase [Thermoplasmata archaeon]